MINNWEIFLFMYSIGVLVSIVFFLIVSYKEYRDVWSVTVGDFLGAVLWSLFSWVAVGMFLVICFLKCVERLDNKTIFKIKKGKRK